MEASPTLRSGDNRPTINKYIYVFVTGPKQPPRTSGHGNVRHYSFDRLALASCQPWTVQFGLFKSFWGLDTQYLVAVTPFDFANAANPDFGRQRMFFKLQCHTARDPQRPLNVDLRPSANIVRTTASMQGFGRRPPHG
jgi:hypothetical protein